MAPAAKKTILKIFYRIVLVHLILNVAFKNKKTFSDGWILNFIRIVNTGKFVQLPHCLTTFASLDAKENIVQPQFYSTTTNLLVRCAFWGSDESEASALCCFFYLPLGSSSSCSKTISMC